MSNQVKLQLSGTTIGEIVKQYLNYKEYQHYYHKDNTTPVTFVDDATGIPCIHWDLDFVINEEPSPVIIVDMLTEGLHVQHRFPTYRKDRKYIFLSNGTWDKSLYDFGFEYEILYINYFLFDYATQMTNPRHMNYYVDKQYTYRPDAPYLFTCLIGKVKPCRDYFVDYLQKNIAVDNYYLTYNGQELQGSERAVDIDYNFNKFDACESWPSLTHYTLSYTIPTEIFNQSCFNLVVETSIDLTAEFHLTEKTIKAIMSGVPFVLMAGAGYLQELRKIGFRTFDSLWSEEYDNIEDFKQRSACIVDLVNSLNKFDWENNQKELQSIANHNKIVLAYSNDLYKQQFKNMERIFSEV